MGILCTIYKLCTIWRRPCIIIFSLLSHINREEKGMVILINSLEENESGRAKYIVTFKDSETYQFNETEDVELVRSSIKMMLEQNKVPFNNMDVGNVNESTTE